ncbi:MarR family transcriptional regulator [Chelatococcus sp. SYSU_G07232]|uniref:MarR family transcriptional regulator n=1 Tax=Chelatococcus albus TaxID=3047466 RepID=A0ABT7AHK6_9HYPH|nr:MarR family transcriptional regulator [Chelatococcus sp. SYSU_G07232]MDJ1158467.1 MarR family transcriptional regulator [Chelatococcus sp. SYSU_G07232]
MRRKADESLRLDNQVCFAVYAAGHAFTRAYKPLLGKLGLTYPQYLVMLLLWEHDGPTMREIGERLHLDSGTLTPLLKRLETMGLVHRARLPEDERQLRVTLTDKGRALREAAADVPRAIGCASGLAPDEAKRLRHELVALQAALARAQ